MKLTRVASFLAGMSFVFWSLACGGTEEKEPEANGTEQTADGAQAEADAASGGCDYGERVPDGLDPWTLVQTYSCHGGDTAKNEVKPKVLMAATPEFYGKDVVLYGTIEIDDYYNYKYGKSEDSHYSFSVESDDEDFNAYGEKSKFKQLFGHLAEKDTLRAKITIRTDEGHGDNGIWTLVAAEPDVSGFAGECCSKIESKAEAADEECGEGERRVPDSGDAWELAEHYKCYSDVSGGVNAKVLIATWTEYHGKEVEVFGTIEIDDYYNYKYSNAEKTHYSFSVESGDEDFNAYGAKDQFRDLFMHLADVETMGARVVITTDPSHEDNGIYTLVSAEPDVLGHAGRCCSYKP